jgi:hypothetical protein
MSLKDVFEQARRNKAARAVDQAAQQSPEGVVVQRKGLFGLPSRKPMVPPKMMADMAAKAQANMPTAGTPAMGGRYGVTDRGENTKDFKKGGKVKKMAKGGSTASKRADGCATKGKTKGRFV